MTARAGHGAGGQAREHEAADRARAEMASQQVESDGKEFLATLAPVTRNSLDPIHNAVRLLTMGGANTSTGQTARDSINAQLRNMVRSIDDLLDVIRIANGKFQLHRERVELAALMEKVRELCLLDEERSRHAVTISLPAQPVYLDADPLRLTQVFVNLLNYACKAAEERGCIGLTAEMEGSDILVKVSCTGIGIPPEHLPSVFETSAQAESVWERSQDRLGYGLSLARDLVQLHAGRIEVRSDDHGSAFIVRLPVLGDSAAAGPPRPDEADPLEAIWVPRVLVVGDNPVNTEALALLLVLNGNEATTTSDVQEAIAVAARDCPHLVLLDFGLARQDGADICRRIREQPCAKDVRIIVLTSREQEGYLGEIQESGFDGHLVKPAELSAGLNLQDDESPPGVDKNPRASRKTVALEREIAERRRAERMAQESRQQLADVLESALDAIISIDTARCVVFFNQAAETMFRCPAGAALAQPIERFLPEGLRAPHLGHTREFLARDAPSRGIDVLSNRNGLRGDGEVFPIEVSISNVDMTGGLLATLVVRDISQQVALEAVLAASKAHMRYITETAEVGYWDWDIATDQMEWSARCKAICGITSTEPMTYKRFLAAVDPKDRERTYAALHAALAGEDDYDIEFRVLGDDGQVRWVHAKGRATYGPDGRPLHLAGIAVDSTWRKDLEAALRESEMRFYGLADAAPAMLWVTAADGTSSFLSRGWHEYTGRAQATGQDVGWFDALHPDDREAAADHLRAVSGHHESFEHEYRILRADGVYRWALAAGRPRFAPDGTFLGYIGSLIDIDERKRAEQYIREAALHDPLTGLPNRELIFTYGDHQLAAAQRRHGGVAMLFVVLNRFKSINDRYGRETGDSVLKEVAKRLRDCTRREDLVGRLADDEFVILLSRLDINRNRAAIVAKHVLESVSQPMRIGAHDHWVIPSIGISCYPEHGIDIKALIQAADLAKNQAKQSRQSNYLFYSHDLERDADEAPMLEQRLRKALREGGLVLHYQPLIDMRSGRLVAAEALVRLLGEEGETIAPHRFIGLAESLGLIGELDEWVATTACRQQGEWIKQGLQPVAIALNVSALEFQQQDLAERFGRIISDAGIDPAHLHLELTESTLQTNTAAVIGMLHRVKSLGVQIALDEYGSCHTDLILLGSLPIDTIKIDPSFVKHIGHDRNSLAVAQSIITRGQQLSLEVIGEGIESEVALRHLRDSGCHRAQGFLVSRPLPSDEFAHWCRRHAH